MPNILFRTILILFLTRFTSFQLTTTGSHTSETLNLAPQIELFHDCSLQIVLNHVTKNRDSFNYSEAYNIAPLSFPIVLLSINYAPLSIFDLINRKRIDTICDGKFLTLLPNQGPKFRRIPDQRQKCFVQVYIDPLPCRQWTVPEFSVKRPKGIFDMVIDQRLYRLWPMLALGNRAFIHVTKTWESRHNNLEMLFIINNFWWRSNNITPIKLLFFIRYSELSHQFLVEETSVLTCKLYNLAIDNIKRICDNSDFLAGLSCKTLEVYTSNSIEFPRLIYDEKSIQTREQLDNAIYRSVPCQNLNWLALLPIKSYSQKDKERSTYVTELSSNEKEGLNAKAVLFGILFPNATILGHKYDEYLFTHGWFVWHQPSFDPHDRVSIAVDTISFSSNLKSVHFITCAPVQRFGWLSLFHLFSSFTLAVWIGLILFSILAGLCTWASFELRCKFKTKKQRDGHFSGVWLAATNFVFIWKIMVQQGYPGKLRFSCVSAAWLAMGTLLTFQYLGDSITQFSAPIETQNIESFEELFTSNFTIYSPINENQRIAVLIKLINDAGELGSLLYNTFSDVLKEKNNWDHESIFSKLLWKNAVRYNYSGDVTSKILREREKVWSRKTVEDVELRVNDSYKVAKISECKMDAYLDTDENIQRLKLMLASQFKFSHHKSVMSKKPFAEMHENWELDTVPIPVNIILKRFHSLFQSGLIHWWNNWAFRVTTWNLTGEAAKNVESAEIPIPLSGNIQVLFFLYLGMTSGSIIIFVGEMGKLIFGAIGLLYFTLCQIFKRIGAKMEVFRTFEKCYSRFTSMLGKRDSPATIFNTDVKMIEVR
ncbi:unnamed protein product [Orchesella dallaii]|uniref:Uncharacterized protein n=1 Tax=Orchesella dallaii TaxID=48710 RepID=A0ABP1RJC4_9HEXA